MRRACGFVMLVLSLIPGLGCYSSVPLDAFPPPPGADVDLHLTTEGTAGMASILGPKVTGVQGRFDAVQSDTVYVNVSAVSLTNGDSNFWQHERIGVPRPYVANVSLRKLSAPKSGLVAAAVVAGIVGITSLVVTANGRHTTKPPPTGQ